MPPGLLACLLLALAFGARTARADDLRNFHTRHYHVHTDLDPELTADLARRLDAMYDEYARRLVDFPRPDDSAPFEVYLVHTEEKYLHLAGLTLKGTGGSFNARRKLLAAFLDGAGRDSLRRTLQHEAFHQFASEAVGGNLPVWVNEGLAQVFEEGIWTGDGFSLGQVPPRRILQLRHDVERGTLIDFGTLLSMTGGEWASHWRDPGPAATQYNQAWAMTHFLVYAADDAGRPKYRARLIEMLKRLRDGQAPDAAFRAAFSANVAGFHDRFIEWADALRPTPEAALIEHEGVLADLLAELKSRGRTFATLDEFRAACRSEGWQINYARGDLKWSTPPTPTSTSTPPAAPPSPPAPNASPPPPPAPWPTWSAGTKEGCK